jgi:hypothetical protein
VNSAAPLLLLRRGLLRARVRTPIFVARALPLRTETFDFGGPAHDSAHTGAYPAGRAESARCRSFASDAVGSLVELGQSGACLRKLRPHHRRPPRGQTATTRLERIKSLAFFLIGVFGLVYLLIICDAYHTVRSS